MPKSPVFVLYGVLMDGTREKFKFEYTDRREATKKQQEIRNIIGGARYNSRIGSKYGSIIVEEEFKNEEVQTS